MYESVALWLNFLLNVSKVYGDKFNSKPSNNMLLWSASIVYMLQGRKNTEQPFLIL